MGLLFVDLVALSKADEKERTIDMNSREVFVDPMSRERLLEAGFIVPGGKVTDAGMEALVKIRKREEELRKGIACVERKGRDSKRALRESPAPWFFAVLGKDQVVTNGEILLVGNPDPDMHATRAKDELKKEIPDVIRRSGRGVFKQVWPHSYQAFSFGGVDLVWLSDQRQELMLAVQAKYLDFLFGRFPRSTFWATSLEMPVQVRVRAKGIKDNVVALIAVFNVADVLEVPKKIKGWKEASDAEVQVEEMPAMGEESGSCLREGEEQ